MRRILLMVLRNLLIVPGGWIKLCYRASHVDKYTEEDNYEFLRWIVFRANKGGNVTIDVHGQENIPKQDGFMFFPNHQGLYDVLAIVEACTHPFSVVAKKEVENVPFLKQVFKIMKAFMIDREDVRQAMKIILEISEEAAKGKRFILFPEGGYDHNRNTVEDFKAGSFKSAVRAKVPIVPVALIDSYKVFNSFGFGKVTTQVHFLEPIPYEEYQGMKTFEIAALVKSRIEAVIEEETTGESAKKRED